MLDIVLTVSNVAVAVAIVVAVPAIVITGIDVYPVPWLVTVIAVT